MHGELNVASGETYRMSLPSRLGQVANGRFAVVQFENLGLADWPLSGSCHSPSVACGHQNSFCVTEVSYVTADLNGPTRARQ